MFLCTYLSCPFHTGLERAICHMLANCMRPIAWLHFVKDIRGGLVMSYMAEVPWIRSTKFCDELNHATNDTHDKPQKEREGVVVSVVFCKMF